MSTWIAIRTISYYAVARCLVEVTVTNVDGFSDDVDVGSKKSTKRILFVKIEIRFQIMSYHVTTDD